MKANKNRILPSFIIIFLCLIGLSPLALLSPSPTVPVGDAIDYGLYATISVVFISLALGIVSMFISDFKRKKITSAMALFSLFSIFSFIIAGTVTGEILYTPDRMSYLSDILGFHGEFRSDANFLQRWGWLLIGTGALYLTTKKIVKHWTVSN